LSPPFIAAPRIFVIGTASLDILHVAGQSAHTIGGAGLYTALAARRAGAATGLIAPRPEPVPEPFRTAAHLLDWMGPVITSGQLPRLEIEHHGGGKATLLNASWGGEPQLVPAALPAGIDQAAYVHIAALSSAQRQLDFVDHLIAVRADKPHPLISAGTYARLAYGDTERIKQLVAKTDLFFMNDNEATALFGTPAQACARPGALLFVTLGENGALLIEGDQVSHIPAHPVIERDPTGAGDTFCGAVLAHLAQGKTALAAVQEAVVLAAANFGSLGPAALLNDASSF
jgi:ribokinase